MRGGLIRGYKQALRKRWAYLQRDQLPGSLPLKYRLVLSTVGLSPEGAYTRRNTVISFNCSNTLLRARSVRSVRSVRSL